MKFGRSLLAAEISYSHLVVVPAIWVIQTQQWIPSEDTFTLPSGMDNFNSRWRVEWAEAGMTENVERVIIPSTAVEIIVNGTDLLRKYFNAWDWQGGYRVLNVGFSNLRAGSTVTPYRIITPDGIVRWSNPAVMLG